MRNYRSLAIIIILVLFNFAIQSLNILQLRFCDFYTFHPECSSLADVILNKLFRLSLNICILYLIPGMNTKEIKNVLPQFFLVIGFLTIIDFLVFFYFNTGSLIVIHKVLNPLLYSPLIAIALLAYKMVNQENPKESNH